jgi:hypothetical protein
MRQKLIIKLPGFIKFYKDYLKFLKLDKNGKKLSNSCNLEFYDGVSHPWTGGRLNRIDENDIDKCIEFFHKNNFPLFFTFTNFKIDPTLETGYIYLNKLIPFIDGIILSDDTFLNKIKSLNFKTTKSITSIDFPDAENSKEKFYKLYEILFEQYDRVVIRNEHVFIEEQYQFFKPLFIKYVDKIEILLNSECDYFCPKWEEHFHAISEFNTNNIVSTENDLKQVEKCWLKELKRMFTEEEEKDRIKFLISEGFYIFKIAGRESKFETTIAEVLKLIPGLKDD